MKNRPRILSAVCLFVFLAAQLRAAVTNFYVTPTGSSGNTGLSLASPWPFQHALNNAGASNIVNIATGDYYLTNELVCGQSWLTIQAITKWGPRLIWTNAPIDSSAISVYPATTHHVTIDGLQVTNCLAFGISLFGPTNTVKNCWVTHVGTAGYHGPTNGGGYAIYAKSVNETLIERNLVEYNGSVTDFDEALYIGGTNIVVRNNVVRYNYAWGLHLNVFSGHFVKNAHVYNNLSYSNAVGGGTALEFTINADGGTGHQTNYIYGNIFLSRQTDCVYINRADGFFTNNIFLGGMLTGAQGTWTGGNNLTNISAANYVNTAKGLYWPAFSSSARGAARTDIFGPVDFFNTNQTSVVDIGAFQYSATRTNDSRTLDPSPDGGADYWYLPAQISVLNVTTVNATKLNVVR